MGFNYVAVGSDIGVLRNAVEQLRARFAPRAPSASAPS